MTTTRTAQILDYLRSYHDARGYAPTYREIAKSAGLKTTSTVTYHLKKLEKAGAIRWDKDKNGARVTRGIVLNDRDNRVDHRPSGRESRRRA